MQDSMKAWRLHCPRRTARAAIRHRVGYTRPFTAPLLLPAHGALGVWDEVAVGALLVGCAIAYAVWFYLSGRNEKPDDTE